MRKIATIIFFLYSFVFAQNEFIITVKTDNIGASGTSEFTIPTNPGSTYNYDVDIDDDGIFDVIGQTGDYTHDFGVAGTYTIRIQGTFPRILFNNGGDKDKLISIDQWGSIVWQSMENAFQGCTNMNCLATDAPNLSGVLDLEDMFNGCSSFNGDIDSWDVSSVEDMRYMFSGCTAFNQDLNSWNVINVTNMRNMFQNAAVFNGDITSWNVSSCINVRNMFQGASVFNQDISGWVTSSVRNFSAMFRDASSFNQAIGGWNVSSSNNFSNMFRGAIAFNQPLNAWNVSGGTTFLSMFQNASAFNQDLNSWVTTSATNMTSMFRNASSFNGNISNWNVGGVTLFSNMFYGASNFNQDISAWNTSSSQNFTGMFREASSFNQAITLWSTSNCTNFSSMFRDAIAFNQPLVWDLSSATSTLSMFRDAIAFDGIIGTWDMSSVIRVDFMFEGASSFNQDITSWDMSSTFTKNSMFLNASSFNQDISGWSYANDTSLNSFLSNATSFDQNLTGMDLSNVKRMSGMLNFTAISQANYDASLNYWNTLTLQDNVTIGVNGLTYCNDGNSARDNIITTFGWNFSGDNACSVLPIVLVSFDVKLISNNTTQISWVTATEINNDYFTIEKSSDLENWSVLGYEQGAGNSIEELRYFINDNNLTNGETYYRLSQTDFDGTSVIFDPVSITSLAQITVHPNPVQSNGVLKLEAIDVKNIETIYLTDLKGMKTMLSISTGNQIILPNNVSKGIYILNILSNKENRNTKLIVR